MIYVTLEYKFFMDLDLLGQMRLKRIVVVYLLFDYIVAAMYTTDFIYI